jgi:alkaline phosphatase
MAGKTDRDLFERLRSVGLRKQVARKLSAVGDGAGKKALRAARAAVGELRSLADELERRLPDEGAASPAGSRAPAADTGDETAGGASAAHPGDGIAGGAPAPDPANGRPQRRPAPRGKNQAAILKALEEGPKTAAEVARATGIRTGTVSATLNKLARSGQVQKAARGYSLPS